MKNLEVGKKLIFDTSDIIVLDEIPLIFKDKESNTLHSLENLFMQTRKRQIIEPKFNKE